MKPSDAEETKTRQASAGHEAGYENKSSCCSTFNWDDSETVAYNNPLFPAYVRYGCLSAYPDYSAISHWHPDLELILVKKGTMMYQMNEEHIELSENNGLLVNSRQIHRGFSPTRSECEFICILLNPELLRANQWFYENCIEPIVENPSYPYLYLDGSGWQSAVLDRIDRIYHSCGDGAAEAPADKSCYFRLLEDFLAVMKLLCENLPADETPRQTKSAELASLKSMLTYIEEHYAESVTLSDIAGAGACCKSRCSLLFRKYLQDTPLAYTVKLRLRKSQAALLNSDASITEIAYAHGFNGASYYCETFRKYYQVSPARYRKTHMQL
ncbi:MAG: helix-turn-helix transcriptional regulator [Lachnospiraceae bacterium]|nr:helix-turn-helix transcriptional regulator [Lachnospiraceae bacterium]